MKYSELKQRRKEAEKDLQVAVAEAVDKLGVVPSAVHVTLHTAYDADDNPQFVGSTVQIKVEL